MLSASPPSLQRTLNTTGRGSEKACDASCQGPASTWSALRQQFETPLTYASARVSAKRRVVQ
jgi:hypothetical protein